MTDVYQLDTRLTMYSNLPKNGIGAEIGVCKGGNAAHLFIISKPQKLHLVDTWEKNVDTDLYHPVELIYGDWRPNIERIFIEEIKSESVIIHKTTGIEFLNSLPNRTLDWIYLDSDHSFDNVIQELRLSSIKVKRGGVISGHDFIVHEKAWKSGVVRAVISVIQEGLIKMEAITNETYSSYFCRVL